MSHIQVHKCSFYTLYRASEREEKLLAVSQAVLLLHLAKSPWRKFVLVGLKKGLNSNLASDLESIQGHQLIKYKHRKKV